jgi:hypothetical protein
MKCPEEVNSYRQKSDQWLPELGRKRNGSDYFRQGDENVLE